MLPVKLAPSHRFSLLAHIRFRGNFLFPRNITTLTRSNLPLIIIRFLFPFPRENFRSREKPLQLTLRSVKPPSPVLPLPRTRSHGNFPYRKEFITLNAMQYYLYNPFLPVFTLSTYPFPWEFITLDAPRISFQLSLSVRIW